MHEDKLYAIAMQCAKLNSQGCACGCHQCQFNVFNYVDDVREASLLKANAYTDYYSSLEAQMKRNEIEQRTNRTIGSGTAMPFAMLIVIAGLIIFCVSSLNKCVSDLTPATKSNYSHVNPRQSIPGSVGNELRSQILQMFMNESERQRQKQSYEQELQYLKANPNKIENIPRVLTVLRMATAWDINHDGMINCIDYAIIFRMLYGSNARIIINVNQRTKMNHMFIRVLYNNGTSYMDIEPQGTPERYSMGLIWGVDYDPSYNEDVTSRWTHVVGGM